MDQDILAIVIITALAIQIFGEVLAVWIDPYIHEDKRRVFLVIMLIVSSLVVQNYTGYLLDSRGSMPCPMHAPWSAFTDTAYDRSLLFCFVI